MATKLIVQETERYKLTVVDGTRLTIQVGAPVGPSGPAGSDATVTNASVNAAISTNTSATKSALGIISADITDAVSDSSLTENFEKLLKSDADGQLTLGEVFASEITVGTGAGNGTIWILGGGNPSGITNTNGANGISCALPTTSGTLVVSTNTNGTLSASDVGLGSVENTALSTWSGSANINTVGTITSGVWNGNPIDAGYIADTAYWDGKQDALVSGTNIKTINSASLLGAGNIAIAEANATNIATVIASATEKTTPVDADQLGITDSAASGALKRLTFANLWTWVKSKLDTALTIAGSKTFSGQIELTGQAATNATSAMTRLLTSVELCQNGNEFRMMVLAGSQSAGTGASAGAYMVVGVSSSINNAAASTASCYTFDSIQSHAGFSGSLMRSDKEIDAFFHGCMLRVEANTNWVIRINFGVGSPTRVPPAAGVDPASGRQWGVEIYYDGSAVVGRLYYFNSGSTVYGTPFAVPGLTAANWPNMVYSIRMRQSASGTLEFYISSPSGIGSPRLPSTPTATLAATWTAATYGGRYINFEVAAAAAAGPSISVRFMSATMFCRFVP